MSETKPPTIAETLEECRVAFEQMQVDSSMSFDREMEWALQTIFRQTGRNGSTPEFKTRDAAQDNLMALREAFLNVAAIGVTLNPARKLAYLLVRDKRIVYDLSYLGLVDIAVSVGAIRWAQAELVYKNDTFKRVGVDRAPIHEFDPFGDRGELVGVYVVAKLMDGDFLTTTMSIAEVNEIKKKSYGASSPHSPWNAHFGEMAKKTVIKRASKLWKVADANMERLDAAIHHLNTDGGEGIDFSLAAEAAPAPAPSVTMPKPKEPPPAPAPEPAPEREPGQDEDEAPAAAPAPQPAPAPAPKAANDDGPKASAGMVKWLQSKGDALKAAMQECGVDKLDGLTEAQFKDLRSFISTGRRAA